ncbi:hypothetical protein CTAYLR_004260 [Chrysophaeum taylorii]|uniref:Oxidation resistance protein 1 n=1 Tax=Chrysophaeum taylorii TaxID=2483200 RepID=A0AAD7UEI9_9STRA|nr:hypothetical protein CTAYLR_004260 [Chrysophaeum taylorii]
MPSSVRWRRDDEKDEVDLLGNSAILTPDLLSALEGTLPRALRGYNWKLAYSLQDHGANIGTFFARTQHESPTMLVVETGTGEVLGGFASTRWKPSNYEYYGTGECFLFSVASRCDDLTERFGGPSRVPVVRPLGGQAEIDLPTTRGSVVDVVKTEKSDIAVNKYPWSGANGYFMWCTEASIAMGGGGGAWGLYLDDDFSRGTTGRSDTYDNPPLCSTPDFDIVNLECWAFCPLGGKDDLKSRLRRFA